MEEAGLDLLHGRLSRGALGWETGSHEFSLTGDQVIVVALQAFG